MAAAPADERPWRRTDYRAHFYLDHREFAPFCDVGDDAGFVPRSSQSGERDMNSHISTAGDPMLRKALCEAAISALFQLKRSFALQLWGGKMAGAKGAKRAGTFVTPKLLHYSIRFG